MSKISISISRLGISMEQAHQIINAGRFIFAQPHVHAARTLDYHTFLHIVYGQWDICINGADFTLHAGDTVLLPANVPHYGKKPCLAGTEGYYMHVVPLANDKYPCDSVPFSLPCVINSASNQHIQDIFKALTQYTASSEEYAKRLCGSLFDDLILLLYERSLSSDSSLLTVLDSIFEQNKNVILTNEQLASQMHYSQKALERRFRAQTGMSLHQYQLEYKLSRAIDIIRFYPEITLTEVALMLGFYDSAHFSKVFKRKYGVSPNDYTK